jgi:4-amino-4-deoxy-L-arabinose transferase-like glycosyltransferase
MSAPTVTPTTGALPVEPSHARPGNTRWARPALLVLLAGTALLYLWSLGSSGWANSFYSAAAQAGSQSWEAFFFGSSDSANSITVDKPPASLWLMSLSVRLFGLSSWSILVPEALCGVAAVGLLYAAVRRYATPGAGLIAGAVLALTPVATLMFRFNNPDALLTLLLVAAAYCTLRAIERGSTWWLVLAGTAVGFGFLTKMLQAFLVLPALAVAYLVAAPTPLRRRIGSVLAAGAAVVVSAGWWVAIVELIPAGSRPYIGGSQTNSVLELIFGYNGFGRLTGQETGSVGGAPGGGWGPTGATRLLDAQFGDQWSWLLPAALIFAGALLWWTRRAPRTDRTRAAVLLWGGWLLVTGLVFSYMAGIFHGYYLVALVPAVAALVGIGAATLWRQRSQPWARWVLAATVGITAIWAAVLLGRTPGWQPWLPTAVLVVGAAVVLALLGVHRMPRQAVVVLAAAAVLVGVAGPAAYSLQTASTAHGGAIPTAGPGTAGGRGGAGGPGGGQFGAGAQRGNAGALGVPPLGTATGPGAPGGLAGGPTGGAAGGAAGGLAGGQRGGGGPGGILGSETPSAQVTALLGADAGRYTWVAATVGANSAAGYQLALNAPVMPIGGFNGNDPSPTLAQFQQLVAGGKIHYFIGGGGAGPGMGGSGSGRQIGAWVAAHFTAKTVGTTTLYDLTQPAG